MRTRVFGVASNIAGRLVGLKAPGEAQDIVYDANAEALEEISNLEVIREQG